MSEYAVTSNQEQEKAVNPPEEQLKDAGTEGALVEEAAASGTQEIEQEQSQEERKEAVKKPGSQRLKEQRDAARAEAERLKAELEAAKGVNQQTFSGPPKLEDYGYDVDRHALAFNEYIQQQVPQIVAREVEIRQQQAKQAEMVKTWEEAEAATREKFHDYDEVVDGTEVQRGLVNQQAGPYILKLGNGPEVLYYLSQNEREARRIASLDPIEAGIEYKSISEKLKGAVKPSAKAAPTKTLPKPVEPPRGGGTGATQSTNKGYRIW